MSLLGVKKDLKGIPREICEHKIDLVANAQPIKQRQYKMNQIMH